MFRQIQKEIAGKIGMERGNRILIVKSAHFYMRDEPEVMKILKSARCQAEQTEPDDKIAA